MLRDVLLTHRFWVRTAPRSSFLRFFLDLNYLEDSGGAADVPIALLPGSDTITTLQMDSKLNMDQFEKVQTNDDVTYTSDAQRL